MAREGSLQELLGSSFQSQINNMFTAIPCIVVAIRDGLNGQMVDIQPTINQKMKDGTTKERPVILGVPVSFQVTSRTGLTFPIEVGNTGLAVFSMRNMDAWKSGNGRPSTPMNFAKMDKGDAIFIPGIQPPSQASNNPAKHVWTHSTSDTVIFHNLGQGTETEIRLLESGGIIINTNQDIEANCNNLIANVQQDTTLTTTNLTIDAASSIDITATTMTINVPNTTWTGNINQTGTYTQLGNYTATGVQTFNGIVFSSHKHTGVTAGVGTSGGPTN